MEMHDYTLKIGLEFSSRKKFRTNKPVTENTVLIDLYDGRRYLVQAIYPAKPKDKEWLWMPDTVMHTWPVGSLPEDELSKLRERARYTPDEFCGPLADVVFFPAAA